MEKAKRIDTVTQTGRESNMESASNSRIVGRFEGSSVDEVVARTQSLGSGIDRATAYRVLALLEELGLVRASQLGSGDAVRWERAHPDEHFHLRCTRCGTVDHHVGTLVATVREHLDDGHGFRAETIELTVHGRCAACVGT